MTTKSLRRRPDRTLFMLLQMSGDVHPNPGSPTMYPCPVCARNVTSRGVSYQCNRCSGWVHAKCSGLINAAQYRRSSDSACGPCSTPSPPPTPTPPRDQKSDDSTFTHIRTSLSPLDLWTDPAGVTALLARWIEKLAGGPQAGTSDSPTSKGHGSE